MASLKQISLLLLVPLLHLHHACAFKLELSRIEPTPNSSLHLDSHPFSELRIRPTMQWRPPFYAVKVALGTPPVFYNLLLHVGQSLTWIQCAGCNPHFPQTTPLFNPLKSSTSSLLPCSSPLRGSFPCINNKCSYNIRYGPNDWIIGSLYQDTLWLPDERSRPEAVPGYVFGCNTRSQGMQHTFVGDDRQIDGVLGMSNGALSLISQRGDNTHHRFSYCLHGAVVNYLSFGEDAVMRERGVVTTPLTHGVPYYYFGVDDISFVGRRLGLHQPASFILDTSTPYSELITPVYDGVVSVVGGYMVQKGHQQIPEWHIPAFRYCWMFDGTIRQLPGMVFHFQGGDLTMGPWNVFLLMPGRSPQFQYACLGMLLAGGLTGPSRFGVMQQEGIRVLVDVGRQRLQLALADCARNP